MSYINIPLGSGLPIPVSLGGVSGRVTLDFSGLPSIYTLTITGGTVISGSNYVPNAAAAVRVNVSGASGVSLAFPSAWNWVCTQPTSLATGRFAVLTINSFTSAESGTLAAWAVAP